MNDAGMIYRLWKGLAIRFIDSNMVRLADIFCFNRHHPSMTSIRHCITWILLLVTTIGGNQLVGQSDVSRRFYSIPEDAGMSNSTALCLFKDSRDFLWIGTQDGMSRYDGYRCKQYRWQREGGLSISYVNQIVEDKDGDLLITSHEGLFLFDPATEMFEELLGAVGSAENAATRMITSIEIDARGNLWLGTYDGLIFWHSDTREYEHIQIDDDPFAISPSDDWRRVRSLYLQNDKTLWVGTFEGLLIFDISSRTFEKIDPVAVGLDRAGWSQIFQISEGNDQMIWVSTQLNGLVAIKSDTLEGTPFNQSAFRRKLATYAVYGCREDRFGGLWIATDHGLHYCDASRTRLENYVHDMYDPYSMGDDIITNAPLIEDDMLWLPTRYEGVWYTDLRPTFFTPHSATGAGGLNSSIVSSFAQEGTDRLIIATDGGGLNVVNLEDWSFEYFEMGEPPYFLPTNKTLAVLLDSRGREWIGTWNEGLICYDPSTNTRKLYKPKPGDLSSISSLSIFYLMEDDAGRIWASTWDNGINLYDEASDGFLRYTHTPGDRRTITESPITHLMQDHQGKLWISSEVSGVNCLDPETGEVRYFTHRSSEKSLRSDSVNCCWEYDDALIFVGTNGAGLNVLDPETGEFIDHPLCFSVPAQSVYGIVKDVHNDVWMSTNNGLVRWNPETNKINLYTTKDGIHDNRFGRWAFLQLDSGDILFGGPNGFTQIHAGGDEVTERFPAAIITAVWANDVFQGTGIKINDGRSTNATSLLPVLPSDTRSMRFEFTAPWYRGADRLEMQYRLEGIDKDWINISDLRVAHYHNLRSGHYRFEVRVSNFEGEWSPAIVQYPFVIKTPFWALWYVRLIILCGVLYCFILVVLWQIRRYTHREAELEKRIQQRTYDLNESHRQLSEKKAEIESQNRQLVQLNHTKDKMLSIFAHDIKNPFNAILNFSDLLSESYGELSEAERKEYIEYIRLTSHNVYELLENLLYWSISQERKLPYRPELIHLSQAFQPAFTLYRAIASQRSIVLDVEPIPQEASIHGDTQLMTMVFRNLLNNAIKFSRKVQRSGFVINWKMSSMYFT